VLWSAGSSTSLRRTKIGDGHTCKRSRLVTQRCRMGISTPKMRVKAPTVLGANVEMLKCARCGEVCAKEGYSSAEGGPAQTCGCGVWVSWELWQKIHNQLTGKKDEVLAQASENMTASTRYESELVTMQRRMQDMEDHFKAREAELKDDITMKAREMVALKREVEEAHMARNTDGRRTKEQADDLLMQVQDLAAQRDDLVGVKARNQKELEEAHLQLRLADHRASVAETRNASMEKELVHTKDRNSGCMLRIEALEKKVKDTETAANDWRVHAEMYKQKLAMHVGPTKEIAVEAERLKMDNKRLVGLLEGTDEFRSMMTKCAITRGQHYISLSECLVEEGWISEIYAPEMDRPVDIHLEEYHWLPKHAINVTTDFLKEVFPRLPTGPFMHLLMRLNKVWREYHKEHLAEIKANHDVEIGELRRALDNQKPWQAVHARDKIRHLKKAIKSTEKEVKVQGKRREKEKVKYAEDSRVMMTMGLNTMENLTRQVAEVLKENKELRHKMIERGSMTDSQLRQASPYSLPAYSGGDATFYRALVSPRSRARSPQRTAYGSPSVPLRAPEAPMEGFWAPTPLGQTPTSHYSDDAPTTQPYMEVANKSAEKKQIKTKSSPDAPAAVFKRSDGESAHHRRGVDGVQRGTPLRGTAARSVSVL